MKLSFSFENLNTKENFNIIAELLDNSFTERFVAKVNNNLENSIEYKASAYQMPHMGLEWDEDRIKQLTEELRTHIKVAVDTFRVSYPIDIESITIKKDSESRQLLNFIHRTFTNFYKSKWSCWSGEIKEPKDLDPSLALTLLENINEGVHQIEPYFYYDNSRVQLMQHSDFLFSAEGSGYELLKEEDYDLKAINPEYDLWLPITCMLGKNLLISYIDYDDPSKFDIVNENQFDGSIVIANRDTFISPAMKAWCESFNVTPKYGMPLGNIVQGKDRIDELLRKYNDVYAGVENIYKFLEIKLVD